MRGAGMTRRNDTRVAMVRRRDALALGGVLLLLGLFLGWQGAILAVNQDALHSGRGGQSAALPQTPSDADPMGRMMGQAKQLEEKAAQNPGDYTTWVALGNLYFDTDMHRKSIEAYEKALAIRPDLADVWTDLGVMYRAEHEHDRAVQSFDKALGLNPRHQVALLNKGVVLLFDLGDKDAARQAFTALLAVNPAAKTPDGKKVSDLVEQLSGKQGK